MTTVATIAAEAFDAVSDEIEGVIKACTLTRTTRGEYDTSTGAYSTTTTMATGRAIFATESAVRDIFGAYVAGPGEEVIFLEGLDSAPKENDALTVAGTAYTVTRTGDIAGAGSFFAVMAVKS